MVKSREKERSEILRLNRFHFAFYWTTTLTGSGTQNRDLLSFSSTLKSRKGVSILPIIAAGIVLYNPNESILRKNIAAIIQDIELLILVDNNSCNINRIEKYYKDNPKIVIIKNKYNKGVASALNQIMSFSKQKHFDWVLTLDQDSICSKNLISSYSLYLNFKKVGILSPVLVEKKEIPIKEEYVFVTRCITSGSLVNVKVWELVGKFDEFMFIDLVDFDFCERIIKNGFYILRINKAKLRHKIGNPFEVNCMGKKIKVMNHPSIRKYYMSRNIFYFRKKHQTSFINAFLSIAKLITYSILFENDKYHKIIFILKGSYDGMLAPFSYKKKGKSSI